VAAEEMPAVLDKQDDIKVVVDMTASAREEQARCALS
jgi:hypothetical protein